ncbi:MAG TPA: hypothetical protein VNL74_14065 [Methylococcus sp.]|nr:hypothetical protein [Methylococcus sp.]
MEKKACRLETLGGDSEIGVSLCRECGVIHLHFGFITVKLSTTRFLQFHRVVGAAAHRLGERELDAASKPGRWHWVKH